MELRQRQPAVAVRRKKRACDPSHKDRVASHPYGRGLEGACHVQCPTGQKQTCHGGDPRTCRRAPHINGLLFRNRYPFEKCGRALASSDAAQHNYRFRRWRRARKIGLHCRGAASRPEDR